MHIVIIGATGLVGSNFLGAAIKNPLITKITTLSRRTLSHQSDKIRPIIFSNLTPEILDTLEISADVYFSALGSTIKSAGSKEAFSRVDLDLVLAFAKLAKKSGAKSFLVISSLGANKHSPFYYYRTKGMMEEAVIQQKIPLTMIFRPSLIIGKRENKRPSEELGILFYKFIKRILPLKIYASFGSQLNSIVQSIEREIVNIHPSDKVKIISNFDC